MPQFPLQLNEGDLVDAARGQPDGHGDRGGAEGGRWVRSLQRPSPVPDRLGPGSGHPPAVMGTSLAPRHERHGRDPRVSRLHSLGWRPARGRTSRVASGRRLTYMAGVAGRGLGRGSDGGGGGGSRWLRLALATRDWKMAAARHPHPGTAAWAGRGRRHVASGPRRRGVAGPGVV